MDAAEAQPAYSCCLPRVPRSQENSGVFEPCICIQADCIWLGLQDENVQIGGQGRLPWPVACSRLPGVCTCIQLHLTQHGTSSDCSGCMARADLRHKVWRSLIGLLPVVQCGLPWPGSRPQWPQRPQRQAVPQRSTTLYKSQTALVCLWGGFYRPLPLFPGNTYHGPPRGTSCLPQPCLHACFSCPAGG